jgi:hypothetical protein
MYLSPKCRKHVNAAVWSDLDSLTVLTMKFKMPEDEMPPVCI